MLAPVNGWSASSSCGTGAVGTSIGTNGGALVAWGRCKDNTFVTTLAEAYAALFSGRVKITQRKPNSIKNRLPQMFHLKP